jgi:hypothetical protein
MINKIEEIHMILISALTSAYAIFRADCDWNLYMSDHRIGVELNVWDVSHLAQLEMQTSDITLYWIKNIAWLDITEIERIIDRKTLIHEALDNLIIEMVTRNHWRLMIILMNGLQNR